MNTGSSNRWSLVSLVLVLMGTISARAGTIYVDADAAGASDGSSWCDAYRNPQEALSAAVAGDAILVAEGTYMPDGGYTPVGGTHVTGSADRTATFQLKNSVELKGGYAGCAQPDPDERDITAHETILRGDLSGDDADVACTQNSPDCDSFGGRCLGGSCIIANNIVDNAFHIVTGSGTSASALLDGFTITRANADANAAVFRGAGMINNSGNPTIQACTFARNLAYDGAAMYNVASSPAVSYCWFVANGASGGSSNNGGAIRNEGPGAPALTSCVFLGNAATGAAAAGGAVSNFGSSPEIVNCIFSGNTTTSTSPSGAVGGGAVLNIASNPILRNCAFSKNSAASSGGAIANYNGSQALVFNCIFWNNVDSGGMDASAQVHEADTSASTVNYTLVQGTWTGNGSNNIDSDPMFVDADGADDVAGTVDDDLRLSAGSPCIDAGDSKVVTVTADLDGNARIVNDPKTPDTGNALFGKAVVDMGAYEFASHPEGIPAVSTWGTAALALLILAAGSIAVRRRRIGVG